jgi:sugar-specific transcriptional regulator TrmB
MDLNELTSKFQPIGITGREAEVYIALLKNKALTASEIAKVTSVSINKIYEVLQSLVKKKMCTENYLNGVKLFRSIDPKIAFQNIFSIYEEEINMKKNLFKEELEESLLAIYNKNDNIRNPLDYIEVVTDKGQARDRFLNIESKVENEILFFSKPPFVIKLGANLSLVKNTKKSNVKMKSIYELSSSESSEYKEDLLKIIEQFESLGEEARIIEQLPLKLVIVDENITILSLIDNVAFNPELTTLIVHHPIFALTQKTLFEVYWNNAMTVEEYKKNIKIC